MPETAQVILFFFVFLCGLSAFARHFYFHNIYCVTEEMKIE